MADEKPDIARLVDEAAKAIGPAHEGGKIARKFRLHCGDFAHHDLARGAIDGDDVAALQAGWPHRQGLGLIVDPEGASAGDAGPAHAARNNGGVAGHAAA